MLHGAEISTQTDLNLSGLGKNESSPRGAGAPGGIRKHVISGDNKMAHPAFRQQIDSISRPRP